MKSTSSLPWTIRAELFTQLATLERAGLPTEHALASINLPQRYHANLAAMRKALTRGKTIAQAGAQAGIFNSLETALIAAACQAGSPAATYKRLAEQAALHARLAKQIRAKLALPALMLLLGLLINPLPALIIGSLSAGGYLLDIITPLLVIAAMYLLGKIIFNSVATDTSSSLSRLLLQTPIFGAWYLRSKQRDFVDSLALLLHAGVSIFEAIPIAQSTIHSAYLEAQCKPLLRQLQRGQSLTEALTCVPWLADATLIAMVKTGETSGTLPEMLQRHANLLSADLEHTATQFAAWLPRIIYALIAGWMAWGIIGSGAFMPQVPADL
nr:type II secretion system F family protein [uncultured Deefgea sp.]